MKSALVRWPFSPPAAMFYCLVIASRYAMLGSPHGAPGVAAGLAKWFFASSIAVWVLADARQRQRSLPFDFGAFVFFAWPVLVPVYLFQTRGWRGFIPMAWLLLLYVAAVLCSVVLAAVRE